jgi:hypothetical protein
MPQRNAKELIKSFLSWQISAYYQTIQRTKKIAPNDIHNFCQFQHAICQLTQLYIHFVEEDWEELSEQSIM